MHKIWKVTQTECKQRQKDVSIAIKIYERDNRWVEICIVKVEEITVGAEYIGVERYCV